MVETDDFRFDRNEALGRWVDVPSHRVVCKHYCNDDHIEPGEKIARNEGPADEKAVECALLSPQERLTSRTR